MLQSWLNAISALLLYLPVYLIFDFYMLGTRALVPWLLSLVAFSLIGVLFWTFGIRHPAIFFPLALMVAASHDAFFWGFSTSGLWASISALGALIWSYYIASSRDYSAAPDAVGILTYLASGVLLPFFPELTPYLSLLFVGGLLSIIRILVHLNQILLRNTAQAEGHARIPRSLAWHNHLYIGILVVFSFVVAQAHAIEWGLSWLVRQVLWMLWRIVLFLLTPLHQHTTSKFPAHRGSLHLPAVHAHPASPLSLLIQNLLIWTALTLLGLGILYAIYRGIKKGVRLLRTLWPSIVRMWPKEALRSDGYVDEWEDLRVRTGKPTARTARGLWGRFAREAKWADITDPGERVRYLYRNLVRHSIHDGYVFHASRTPTEVGQDIGALHPFVKDEISELTGVYNQVRYGSQSPTADTVERLRSLLQEREKTHRV